MLSERIVHTSLRDALLENVPFQYAHLIKFERPSRPDASGRASTSAQRYTYLTDASRDVVFDDLSVDLDGNLNGPQNYIANKVLSVGSVSESVEAKADATSIVLDGNGVGAYIYAPISVATVDANSWDVQILDESDPVYEGFREGDKIDIGGTLVNIKTFRPNNVIRVTKIDTALTTGSRTVAISLNSDETKSILLNKNADSYSSFINREVYVYRAYFVDGQMIGETPDSNGSTGPLLLFKGIINSVSFEEDDANGIKVQWGLSSHWGDFSQVRGRITSDEFHRALDENGVPQPDSAIKAIYAYDKGFAHSDTSINLLATYTVMVDKTTIKSKSGFLGFGAKTKVKTVAVAEGRSTALDFQLQAKSIPVIYGVRSTTGIPVFADTLVSNSSEVYVIYALSEGQIGGIYDVYIEGKSLICNNEEDFTARASQTDSETVDVICRGRADRGDVLGGVTSAPTTTPIDFYTNPDPDVDRDLRTTYRLPFNLNARSTYFGYTNPTADQMPNVVVDTPVGGLLHGETLTLSAPQSISLDFMSGTESQPAASQLVGLAKANQFKIQNDYWKGPESAEYWGPNHRLIDTAYVVGKYTIKEGETSIPDIEYLVRGKVIECYNYDYSYAQDQKMAAENAANFSLGDIVALSTGQSVQIIDKWVFCRPDGTPDYRFRFSQVPNLNYVNGVPQITRFSMTKGSFVWTMTTFNWEVHSGTVGAELTQEVTVTPTTGGGTIITYPPTTDFTGGGTTGVPSTFSLVNSNNFRRDILITGDVTTTEITSELY